MCHILRMPHFTRWLWRRFISSEEGEEGGSVGFLGLVDWAFDGKELDLRFRLGLGGSSIRTDIELSDRSAFVASGSAEWFGDSLGFAGLGSVFSVFGAADLDLRLFLVAGGSSMSSESSLSECDCSPSSSG